jgi:hypothetical protein
MKNPIKSLVTKIGVPATLALLISAGLGIAALVNYLSNTITFSATIKSPITLQPDTIDLGTVYGGDTKEIIYHTSNSANNDISGKHVVYLFGPADATQDDLTNVEFEYGGTGYTVTWQVVSDINGDGYKDLQLITDSVTHGAGSSDVETKWTITFNPVLKPGSYSGQILVIPA